MNEPAGQESPGGGPSSLKETLDIFKFLREESEANRAAQRDEAEANRKLLLDTAKWVSVIVSVALTIAGILLFRDLDTFKQQLRNEGEAEAKNEIKRMDKQIDDTLQAQFGSEKIQATISSAAESATREQAPRLIKEVITPEVKKAVDQQTGAIKDLATKAATEKVQSTIDPIAAELRVQDLILRANADEAKAVDDLLHLEGTLSAPQRAVVGGVLTDIEHRLQNQVVEIGTRENCADLTRPDFRSKFSSPVAQTRAKIIEDCGSWASSDAPDVMINGKGIKPILIEEQLIPLLVEVALADTSLSVRAASITALNNLFGPAHRFPRGGLDLVDPTPLRVWWSSNKSNFRVVLLIARASADAHHFDSKELYDELRSSEPSAPPPLKKDIADTLADMRGQASRGEEPTQLMVRMGSETCSRVTSDFGIRLGQGGDTGIGDYGLLELQFLKTCPMVPNYLPGLIKMATTSGSLSACSAATMLINKWAGANLDAFNEEGIRAWWAKHQSDYLGVTVSPP